MNEPNGKQIKVHFLNSTNQPKAATLVLMDGETLEAEIEYLLTCGFKNWVKRPDAEDPKGMYTLIPWHRITEITVIWMGEDNA